VVPQVLSLLLLVPQVLSLLLLVPLVVPQVLSLPHSLLRSLLHRALLLKKKKKRRLLRGRRRLIRERTESPLLLPLVLSLRLNLIRLVLSLNLCLNLFHLVLSLNLLIRTLLTTRTKTKMCRRKTLLVWRIKRKKKKD
jgi:hypothetical protein